MPNAKKVIQLRAFTIDRYRSIRHAAFKPNRELSVLIGPNGSGKTNLLNAIKLLKILGAPSHRPRAIDSEVAPCQISAQFSYGRSFVEYRSSIQLTASAENADEVVSSREEWKVGFGLSQNEWIEIPSIFLIGPYRFRDLFVTGRYSAKWPQDLQAAKAAPATKVALAEVAEFMNSITYYSASRFTDPSKCPSSFETEGDNKPIETYSTRGPHFSFVSGLYVLSRTDKAKYNAFLQVVGPNGIGLIDRITWRRVRLSSSTVDVKTGGKIERRKRDRVLVVPVLSVRRSLVSFNQLSEGTFRALALLYHLMTDQSGMLLVEEPEVCIHQGLLKSVIEAFKAHAYRRQIVISTHSELVLDSVAPENVFAVRNAASRGTTVVPLAKSMSGRDYAALKDYLANSGNLGEYWAHGGVAP